MHETSVAPASIASRRETHAAVVRDGSAKRRARALVPALGVALGLIAGCRAEVPARPDLVLLTVDALAADRLSCFGGPPDAGRSLCALAEGGTLFAWAAAASRGEASAAATVLTGLAAPDHGLRDDGRSFLPESIATLAERFSRAGYRTAAFVASPRLNRSRRLDQGFDHFDDAAAAGPRAERGGPDVDAEEPDASTALANRIQHWYGARKAPRFVWIHADRTAGVAEFDRLVSRLTQTLDPPTGRPGLLFTALRGESDAAPETLEWRALRIPLLWRPPGEPQTSRPRVSHQLAGLRDVAVTLANAIGPNSLASADARQAPVSGAAGAGGTTEDHGRDLDRLALEPVPEVPEIDHGAGAGGGAAPEPTERFILLEASRPEGEVGIASSHSVYVRQRSPLDGTGRPVPTDQLRFRSARFAALPILDRLRHPAPRSAALEPGPWRSDVLAAESPAPRLEFHLARLLSVRAPSTNPPRAESDSLRAPDSQTPAP